MGRKIIRTPEQFLSRALDYIAYEYEYAPEGTIGKYRKWLEEVAKPFPVDILSTLNELSELGFRLDDKNAETIVHWGKSDIEQPGQDPTEYYPIIRKLQKFIWDLEEDMVDEFGL
jgi:hypothetical protein